MTDLTYAFLDEFGDYSFDFNKNGVSTHFIIVSILVKDSNKEMLELEMENIGRKHFQNGRIDSDNLRIQILNELKDLPFSIYAYVIDKRKIREYSGIMHSSPFIKYVNRMVYEDLNKTFKQLDLVTDDKKIKPFIREFKNYIQKRTIPDLFNYSLLLE